MLRRLKVKWPEGGAPALERLSLSPSKLHVDLSDGSGTAAVAAVAPGRAVRRGEPLAATVDVVTHAPMGGIVTAVSDCRVVIDVHPSPDGDAEPAVRLPDHTGPVDEAFLRSIGLVGMGGGMFPASRKLAAARACHTVVINGVECEPGITVDQRILRDESELVRAGVEALAAALGGAEIVLAVRRERDLLRALRGCFPYRFVVLPAAYPAGAETLIVRKLAGRFPAPGERPTHMGYLVHNVASLRALGVALRDRLPVLERPLSVARPDANLYRNVIVPVGLATGELVRATDIPYAEDTDLIVAGGLMMGRAVERDFPISKGTASLVVLPRQAVQRRETPCIRCGACNAACPLGLHPLGMSRRFRNGEAGRAACRIQLETCFLCGACAAVCSAHIPLLNDFMDAKSWLRNDLN